MIRAQIDPARRCLQVPEWPEPDQHAWNAALASDDLLSSEPDRLANWRPATLNKNRRGYGRWLTFLAKCGADLTEPMDDRVTRDRILAYLDELRRQCVAPYTLRNRIGELHAVMAALAPRRDWSWLKACVVRLDQHAGNAADRSLPPVLASDLLARAMSELRRQAKTEASWPQAITYRDWLMVTILAVLPLRLRNFAALSLTRHMERRGGQWWIDIDGSETKTNRPYSGVIPASVGKFVDHYLSDIRPHLHPNPSSDCLWISRAGSALAEHSIYIIITELTKREFGTAINPHRFRHIFATSVSIADPDAIEGARAALGHSTKATTQRDYNRANALVATRIHARIVRRLRAKTGDGRRASRR